MQHNVLAVSYAVRALEPGSREQARMEEFSKTLDRHVMVVFSRQTDGLPAEYHSGNLSIYGTHAKTKLGIVLAAYRIGKRVLREHQGEDWVVSGQNPFEAGLIAWRLARAFRKHFHLQIHGDNFSNPNWLRESLGNRMRYWIGSWLLRRADGIRVVSGRVKAALMRIGIGAHRVVVLPVRVTLEQFLVVGKSRSSQTKETVTFLYVGRLAPEKDLCFLIRAFAGAVEEDPKLRLQLVGAGPLQSELEKLVTELDIQSVVTFTAWTNDVASVMREADVFTLSSKHEGYALVLLEAMAAGLPVITTDVGCVGEVVQAGEHGEVVAVGDQSALTEAMMKLGADDSLRLQYGQAGHAAANTLNQAQAEYATAWKQSFFVSSGQ